MERLNHTICKQYFSNTLLLAFLLYCFNQHSKNSIQTCSHVHSPKLPKKCKGITHDESDNCYKQWTNWKYTIYILAYVILNILQYQTARCIKTVLVPNEHNFNLKDHEIYSRLSSLFTLLTLLLTKSQYLLKKYLSYNNLYVIVFLKWKPPKNMYEQQKLWPWLLFALYVQTYIHTAAYIRT